MSKLTEAVHELIDAVDHRIGREKAGKLHALVEAHDAEQAKQSTGSANPESAAVAPDAIGTAGQSAAAAAGMHAAAELPDPGLAEPLFEHPES